MDQTKKTDRPNPYVTANVISKLFFLWQIPLYRKGYNIGLDINDLFNILKNDLSENLGAKLERNWKNEIRKAKENKREPKLFKALCVTFLPSFIFQGFILTFEVLLFRMMLPIVLGRYIAHFEPNTKVSKEDSYIYAISIGLCSLMVSLIHFHTAVGLNSIGMRIRVACCSLMYRKMLRLNNDSLRDMTSGQIVNLMSNDVNRFDQTVLYLHYIWMMPFQAAVVTYLMYKSVGVAAFVGMAILAIITIPIEGFLSRLVAKYRFKIAFRTDDRIKLMNEVISGIQIIKMYAWEKPFESLVSLSRKKELKPLIFTSRIKGFTLALMMYTERFALYVTLVTFVLMGNDLTSEIVFSMATYFSAIQLYMAIFFPVGLITGGEALVSVRRIQTFLLKDENTLLVNAKTCQNGVIHKSNEASEQIGSIKLENISASWLTTQIVPTLSSINLNINPGQLIGVVGPVGSGKSSLLQILLRELPIHHGKMKFGGKISYCSQEAWLFQSSVRNNILFGFPYDETRYNDVVRVCALRKDFAQLPYGDKTLIGNRGSGLSGGQKARINLARAVYRQADIYLLDDPLSAVDTHVGRHLYDKCIVSYLFDKTRIIVTHQIQYLKNCDQIIIMNNGKIEQQGSWREVGESGDLLNNMKNLEEEKEEYKRRQSVQSTTNIDIKRRASLQSYSDIAGSQTHLPLQGLKDDESDDDEEPKETEELMEKGALKSETLLKYFRAGGSWFYICFIFFLIACSQLFTSAVDYFLPFWLRQEQLRMSLLNSLNSNNFTTSTMQPILQSTDGKLFKRGLNNFSSSTNDSFLKTSTIEPTIVTTSGGLLIGKLFEDEMVMPQQTGILIYSTLMALFFLFVTSSYMLFYKLAMKASQNLHDTMFGNILQATMRFFDTNPSGRILNRFSKDMGIIDDLIPQLLVDSLILIFFVIGVVVLVLLANAYMVFALIVSGICFWVLRNYYIATVQDLKRLEGITRSPVFSHVTSSMDGLVTIRSCNAEQLLIQEFDIHQNQHTKTFFLIINTSASFSLWLDMVSITLILFVAFSFLIFFDGTAFSGKVGLAITQAMFLTGSLQYGLRQASDAVSQMTSVERVLQYTRLEKEGPFESEPNKKPSKLWPSKGQIEFINMYLKYDPNGLPTLKDLNLVIEAGSKIGIVGRTGAGKSSIMAALFRLAYIEGDIQIDDVSIKSIGLNDLRTKLSIIPQQPILFSASLRYNLDPFNKSTDEQIWKALDDVELKDIADSLDFKISAGGTNLSVGQRQLLCLARAILRQNKILIMDEATANVDPSTDNLIQTTIRKKFVDCTVLTIAHRLNTIIDSDKVIVLDQGKILEYDHAHMLLQNPNGVFTKMLQQMGSNSEIKLRDLAKQSYESNIDIFSSVDLS